MTFSLKFQCDNAAFEDHPLDEIARILRDVANAVGNGQIVIGKCRDVNGKTVGHFWLSGRAPK